MNGAPTRQVKATCPDCGHNGPHDVYGDTYKCNVCGHNHEPAAVDPHLRKQVTVRMTPAELEILRVAATREGLGVTTWIRTRCLAAARSIAKRKGA